VHRRHLLLLAEKSRQHRIDGAIVQRRDRSALDHLGLAISGLRTHPQLYEHSIGFPGAQ
jgi:hypothetical protein